MKQFSSGAMVIASILLFARISPAQITITSDNVPTAGTTVVRSIDELPLSIDPGPAGPDQVWEFSPLVTDKVMEYSYQLPSETPYFGNFPYANLAMHVTDTAYSYLYYDDAIFTMQGVVGEFEDMEYVFDYIPDMIIANFPFTYGDHIVQSYSFEFVYDSSNDSIKLKTQVARSLEADAYGIVNIPAGSFEAIRTKTTQITKDTMWAQVSGNWILISSTINTSNFYDWYTNDPDVDIELVSLTYDENWTMLESAEYFKESFVGVETFSEKPGIKIFPNPAYDRIFIETEKTAGMILQLINMTGEMMIEEEIRSGKEEIAIPGTSPGIYICRIVDNDLRSIYQQKILLR